MKCPKCNSELEYSGCEVGSMLRNKVYECHKCAIILTYHEDHPEWEPFIKKGSINWD